ncbi:MAG: hypothetical protein KAS96_12535 [Planctomycetes bacterium]|nr:hypothetical protein [Planctomycetota bacterium]
MAKKKKKNQKTFFIFNSSRKKKRKKKTQPTNWMTVLKILLVVCIFVGGAVGLVFLDKYVKKVESVSERPAILKLTGVPQWVNEALKDKIYAAASGFGQQSLTLSDDAAMNVQRNIDQHVPWLSGVSVRTTNDRLLIEAQWRKPVALIGAGKNKFYVDENLVMLDYVDVASLPIIKVTGLSGGNKVPVYGQVWMKEDLQAAVAVLTMFNMMDNRVAKDNPLLFEISRIDMSNFNGRRKKQSPHVVLYATDGTEIIWGAEIGTWHRYMESPDEEKLAKLYGYYKEYGSLLHGVKFINLREPTDRISKPIDKYNP